MISTDFAKANNIILAYPERFYNEFEKLTSFYDNLIDLIPNDIQIWLIVNNNSTCIKIKDKYRFKKINVVPIKYWDEIWLRDSIGLNGKDEVIKPYYFPKYCCNESYPKYYEKINKLTRILIKECLQKKIVHIPLTLDGGNFVNNNDVAFITDKILDDNAELSKTEIIKILNDFTGLRPEIIKRSKSDIIGHTDGFMTFVSNDKVLLSNYPSLPFLKEDIDFVFDMRKRLQDERLEVIEFYDRPIDEVVPCECYRKTKKACFYSARGNYINLLRIGNTVILPEYTLPTLKETKYYNSVNHEILVNLGFDVKAINCDQLSKLGGSLHCLSYTF